MTDLHDISLRNDGHDGHDGHDGITADLVSDQAPTSLDAGSVTVLVLTDDPVVVDAVHVAEHRHPAPWDVHLVDTEDAALACFGTIERVDVVMVRSTAGGLAESLLDRVRRRSPHTARLALADPSDESAVLRLAALAHQVVPMPLDVDLLSDLVERVRRSARRELRDPVRTLVGQANRLPSPPAMYQRVSEILASADWRIEDLVAEIGQDPALTGELFKLVNSSFYGLANQVTSVGQAISLIGAKLTRFIVLGNKMFQSNGFETWIDLERLAGRSRAVAHGAQALATREHASRDEAARAYLAGLVSEIGLLVVARLPDIAPSVAAPLNGSAFLGAERVLFGGDRFEVGAHLLTLWGFDDGVVEAVRRLSTGEPSERGDLGWYLANARRLVVDHGVGPEQLAAAPGVDVDVDRAIDEVRAAIAGAAIVDVATAPAG